MVINNGIKEAREKKMNEEFEKRGKALLEKRAVKIESGNCHSGLFLYPIYYF